MTNPPTLAKTHIATASSKIQQLVSTARGSNFALVLQKCAVGEPARNHLKSTNARLDVVRVDGVYGLLLTPSFFWSVITSSSLSKHASDPGGSE